MQERKRRKKRFTIVGTGTLINPCKSCSARSAYCPTLTRRVLSHHLEFYSGDTWGERSKSNVFRLHFLSEFVDLTFTMLRLKRWAASLSSQVPSDEFSVTGVRGSIPAPRPGNGPFSVPVCDVTLLFTLVQWLPTSYLLLFSFLLQVFLFGFPFLPYLPIYLYLHF